MHVYADVHRSGRRTRRTRQLQQERDAPVTARGSAAEITIVRRLMLNLLRFAGLAGFSFPLLITPLMAQQVVIDASHQPSPPARGRGPFPGSSEPGHSAGFPIRLTVEIPDGKLQQDGSVSIDFILTNVGNTRLSLPSCVNQNAVHTAVLTLYLTSDGIEPVYLTSGVRIFLTPTSAELYTDSFNPNTSTGLAPNQSIRVRASSRARFQPGVQTLTGHAELLKLINGSSEQIGTADSEPVQKKLFQ